MANDPYWNSVVLAMHMDDTGLTDLKGHVVTLNGNVARSATQSKFGGYSAYFDGTGDYLTVTGIDLGRGAMTVEGFFYITSLSATNTIISQYLNSPDGRWGVQVTSAGVASCFVNGLSEGNLTISSATTILANTWYHFAVTRSNIGVFDFYINGVISSGGAVRTGALPAVDLCIGGLNSTSTPTNTITGYIDDLRITKGVARYTANFAVPTEAFPNTPPQLIGTIKDSSGTFVSRPVIAIPHNRASVSYATISDATTGAFTLPTYDGSAHTVIALPVEGDPYWDSVVLAMHMDGTNGSTTFTDEKGHTVTAYGGAQISTAQSKFGGVSAYFDGTGDYISIASSLDYAFSSGDFTVEFFVRFSVVPGAGGYVALLSKQNTTGNEQSFTLWYGGTEKWIFTYSASGTSTAGTSSGLNGNTPSVGTWYNIALVRANNQLNLFVNGVRGTAFAMNGNAIYSGPAPLLVGAANALSPAYFINGYIDDLRITKGVARYIHNFTPPSSAFPHAVSGGAENALILDNITPV